MKHLLLLILITSQYINAQVFPDYKERRHPFITDTTLTEQMYAMGATEGVIDPEEYILAPGDRLFISISGIEEIPVHAVINHEGTIYIPQVGGVDLKNLSLSEGKHRILERINKYFKNVDVFVSLVEFRKIKVSFIGDVKKPSSFVVSGNSRLVDLIMVSSGFNNTSDLRNIQIKNRQGEEKKYDLLSFLRLGDRKHNPLLSEGDVAIVNKVDKTVSISGQILYPGSYEFVEGENAQNLIALAGGLTSQAKTDTVEVVRFTEDGKLQKSIYLSYNELTSANYILKNKDHIIIRSLPEFLEEKYVLIDGYVNYPGYFKIIEGKTRLSDLIREAGGFRELAALNEAAVTRDVGEDVKDPEFERLKLILRQDMTEDEYDYFKAKSRQRHGNVVVDFNKLFVENDVREDILLRRGDVITIPEYKDYIILIGQVINPGNIIYRKGLNYEDYIVLAGGFGWRALEGDVRIIKANTGEWIDASKKIVLEPGDTIWIPEDPPAAKFWDVFTTSLTVLGQVAAVVAAVVAVVAISR